MWEEKGIQHIKHLLATYVLGPVGRNEELLVFTFEWFILFG